jgi:patatin-like phospholipase/acyl hydrolase
MPVGDERFRILSLDGGGIRGLVTAVWLHALERRLGGSLHEHFDLVAGTSTGSILACGIAKGLRPKDIVDLYENHGREVFPGRARRLWSRATRLASEGASAPKYDDEGLERVLRREFGNELFGDLQIKPTLVTAYNVFAREAVVFKNTKPEHEQLAVWEVVKASASAPTYFPAHVTRIEGALSPLIDGGVVANNPVACAIAEGLRVQGVGGCGLEDFVVASFGTGQSTRPISVEDSQEWGALEWAIPVIDVLFDGASDANDYVARQLIPSGRYFRFQTRLSDAYDDMDNADETNLAALKALARRYLRRAEVREKLDQLVELLS